MKSKDITFNGIEITCYEDGSIEKPRYSKSVRTFGSNTAGYRNTSVKAKTINIHRLIAKAFLPDYSDDLPVDHQNGVKSDNRPLNLRMSTASRNARSFQTPRPSTSSIYRGVSWDKDRQKWRARIRIGKKLMSLGSFTCEHQAALAYNSEATKCGFEHEALNSVIINSL